MATHPRLSDAAVENVARAYHPPGGPCRAEDSRQWRPRRESNPRQDNTRPDPLDWYAVTLEEEALSGCATARYPQKVLTG